MTRNRSILKSTLNKVGYVPRANFQNNSWLESTVCWNIELYVYPDYGTDNNAKATTAGRNHYPHNPYGLLDTPLTFDFYTTADSPTNILDLPGQQAIRIIKPVHDNGYYVLSDAFYQQSTDLSLLELMVNDYLENRPLLMSQVQVLVNAMHGWSAYERFYYGPLVFLFVKDVIRGFY
jgi:hypothetical protein